VEGIGQVDHRLAERRGAYGHDHELLHVDGIFRVLPAVEHVGHRDGESAGAYSAQIPVQRLAGMGRRSPRHCHRYAQQGIGSQLSLGGCAVEGNHGVVEPRLVEGVAADHCCGKFLVDVAHGVPHALSLEPLPAVP